MEVLPTLALAWGSQAGVFVTLTEASPCSGFPRRAPAHPVVPTLIMVPASELPLAQSLLSASHSGTSKQAQAWEPQK